jgi:hypothetical protein
VQLYLLWIFQLKKFYLLVYFVGQVSIEDDDEDSEEDGNNDDLSPGIPPAAVG